MLIAIWALNNIRAHKLLTACCGVLSNSYYYKPTNDFKYFLDQKDKDNTSMNITLIFFVLRIHIEPTRLLKDGASNAEFDADKKLRLRSINLARDDNGKIKEAITMNKVNKDKKKDLQKNIRWLKREKQH